MSNNKILINHSERLGIRDSPTIQKADSYLRVLNTKSAAKTISDAAKVILCLDLAATTLGISFDKETALKLTGLRKTVYQNNLNNLEKILNLDKPATISEICVQFSCTEAKDLAETILHKYQECDTKIKDIKHPQYIAAAVYTSCKLNGIKVDKSQLKLVSRLKIAQWNELLEEFSKFAASIGISSDKKRNAKKSKSAEVEPMESEDSSQAKTKVKEKEEVIEEYEVWRERILREASAEILRNELDEESVEIDSRYEDF